MIYFLFGTMLCVLLTVPVCGAEWDVLPENTVVVVHDLTPSMTADIDKDNVAAIVTETGGRTSHSAILARALYARGARRLETNGG